MFFFFSFPLHVGSAVANQNVARGENFLNNLKLFDCWWLTTMFSWKSFGHLLHLGLIKHKTLENQQGDQAHGTASINVICNEVWNDKYCTLEVNQRLRKIYNIL